MERERDSDREGERNREENRRGRSHYLELSWPVYLRKHNQLRPTLWFILADLVSTFNCEFLDQFLILNLRPAMSAFVNTF